MRIEKKLARAARPAPSLVTLLERSAPALAIGYEALLLALQLFVQLALLFGKLA